MKTNKRTITESQLRNIVVGTVKKVLKEDFKNIDNLSDYIRQNNIQMRQASKFARINAVQAQGGERINTVASDGTQETTNVAKQGDWIVNNVSNPNNKWIIDPVTFAKKYQPDPSQQGVYMPKGGPMMAGQINEPISFNAPWGERMNIDRGGYLMQTPGSETDIYGISGQDFDNTYRFDETRKCNNKRVIKESQLQRVIKESVKRVLKEGIDDILFGRIENAKEVLGADGFIMAMVKYLSQEQVERMMDFIERVYEVPSRDDDEDEEVGNSC